MLSDTFSESFLYLFASSFPLNSPFSPSPPPPPPLLALHHAAFALQSLGARLLPRALAVDVEAHVSFLVQVEELLEELSHIVVGLGRRLHEGALPLVGLGFPILRLHLPVGLITLVAHKHDRDGIHIALYAQDLRRKEKHVCYVLFQNL